MEFRETPEQELLREAVAKIASRYGHDWYVAKARADERPVELWDELARNGYLGVNLPEEYGGGGMGIYELALVLEEITAQGCPLFIMIVSPAICGTILARFGSQALKDRWLPGLCAGTTKMAFAITEPDAGSNTHRLATTATRDGDVYRINGSKYYISGVDEAEALLLVARTGTDAETGHAKLSLFVVPTDTPGLSWQVIDVEVTAPDRQYTLFFDDAVIPAGNLIGEEHHGFRSVFAGLNPERIMVAALSNGISRYALDKAVAYANDRRVWGVPIGAHQGVAHPLAKGKVEAELARLMTQKAAWLYDNGLDAGEAANMAKYAAAEASLACLDQAIQVHGGNGLAREYGLADLWSTARLMRTAPVSREMVLNFVAQQSLGLPKSYYAGAERMESIFGKTMYPSLAEWCDIIEGKLEEPGDDPIWNVAPPEVDDRPFDAIFLGGGGAGRFGAAFMRARGGRPLIIEKWPFLGGSCPHEACVPHHILSECAKELDRAKWFSGQLWFPEFDPKKVSILDCIELVKEGRAGAHALMNVQTKEQLDCEYVLNAWGNVIDKNTVEVAGRTFHCKNLVLATGVRTQVPDIPGTDLKGVYDFATLLSDLDYEPSRCVIIGGSKVAMEYGSFFQAAGVQTTILTRSPLMRTASLHHIDEDLRRYVIEMMELRGIEIIEGAEPQEILGNGRATGVAYRGPDGSDVTIETDFVFIATGERPTANTNAFIESLGVELDDRGFVVVNKRMQTSVPGIYAVGDLIGPPMEQFKARHSGCCAARNIMGEDYEWDCEEYADFLHTTYEVVWCGLTEEEARQKYGRVIKIQLPPDGLPHENCAFPAGEGTMMFACRYPELTGFAKLVIAADSRKIVGAHYCGSGVKNVFQYLDHLIRRPEGITIDELGGFNELQVNDLFIQLCRLRAGQAVLQDL